MIIVRRKRKKRKIEKKRKETRRRDDTEINCRQNNRDNEWDSKEGSMKNLQERRDKDN